MRAWKKAKQKTQDMIQRHGNQIQETTRQNQTQEHNEQESTVMTFRGFSASGQSQPSCVFCFQTL